MRRFSATILLAFFALGASADPRTFADARSMIDDGDAAQAVDLLSPLSATYGGDPEFDYLLGLALLESGQPDAAIAPLQRVINADPMFAGARMDLARSCYFSGRYDQAREHFDILLGQSPPEVARRAIAEYQAAMDDRESTAKWTREGMLRPVIGYDSNANAATAANDFLDFTLDQQSQETGSAFAELNGGFAASRYVRRGMRAGIRSDFQARHYPDASFVDFIGGNVRVGVGWLSEGHSRGIGLRAYRLHVDNDFNNHGLSLEGTWDQAVGERSRLGFFVRAGLLRYEDDLDTKDVDQVLAGVSASRRFGASRDKLITLSALIGSDDATRSDSRYGRTLYGARVSGRWRIHQRILARASLGFQRSDYDKPFFELEYDDDRSDDMLDAEAGLAWTIGEDWQLDSGLRYSDNDSNVDLYRYDRWLSFVGLSRRWR